LHPAIVLKRNVAKSKLIGAGVVDAPIGVLEVGATADLLLLNDDLEVLGTWVGGTKTFERASKLN
jgi:N-acetylglucosamine-6-phosphate deacetylase